MTRARRLTIESDTRESPQDGGAKLFIFSRAPARYAASKRRDGMGKPRRRPISLYFIRDYRELFEFLQGAKEKSAFAACGVSISPYLYADMLLSVEGDILLLNFFCSAELA
jgi:hypothetical protein